MMNVARLARSISGGWKRVGVLKTGDASLGTRSSTTITMAIAIVKRVDLLGFNRIPVPGWHLALGNYEVEG